MSSKQKLLQAFNGSVSSVAADMKSRCTTSWLALYLLVNQEPINIEEKILKEGCEYIYQRRPFFRKQDCNQLLLLSWNSKFSWPDSRSAD